MEAPQSMVELGLGILFSEETRSFTVTITTPRFLA
jgi:hypothetical protein